jgi:hypothetical protein
MKLIDGLKMRGRPAEIPDCSRDDLPQLFLDLGFKTGAEIGVARGEYSEKIAQAGLNLYAIDPWLSYGDYEDSRGQKALDDELEQAKKRLNIFPNCKIIRKTSLEAALDFPDRSLDFVYIDGNHQFMYVAEDLATWSVKVKIGGIISGHDYIRTNPRTQAGICHVIPVLNAYVQAYNIPDIYLLGRYERKEEEVRDRFRSWMFVNKQLELRK